VPSRAAHAGHGASLTLQATPAAGTSPDGGGSPFGTSLITGVLGLALGGVAGLLLTARRRA
jgi:chitin-binding protein